jgi:hypothetical protein
VVLLQQQEVWRWALPVVGAAALAAAAAAAAAASEQLRERVEGLLLLLHLGGVRQGC